MAAQDFVTPGTSPECAEHCPNIKWALSEAKKHDMDPRLVVSAVCYAMGSKECPEPTYSFDEAGDGHRCQAPGRNNISEDMVEITIRGAQEMLEAGPDAFIRSMRGIES